MDDARCGAIPSLTSLPTTSAAFTDESTESPMCRATTSATRLTEAWVLRRTIRSSSPSANFVLLQHVPYLRVAPLEELRGLAFRVASVRQCANLVRDGLMAIGDCSHVIFGGHGI